MRSKKKVFLISVVAGENRDSADSVANNTGNLLLTAQVFNSDCTQTIQRCYGCIQRERKSLEKKLKDKDVLLPRTYSFFLERRTSLNNDTATEHL